MSDAPELDDRSEIGVDELDAQVGAADLQPVGLRDFLTRTRAALGFRSLSAPALLFVPLGAALGPAGSGVLTSDALGHLYPVIAIALAALGVFVGLGLRLHHPADRRLLAFASVEAGITIATVAGVSFLLLQGWALPLGVPTWLLALVLGICASASAAGEARPEDPPTHHAAMRMADLDDVLPIVIGGVVLAMAMALSGSAAIRLLTLNFAAPLAIAGAGWLLFERADDPGERGVFVLGVVTLLGGCAVYLGVSPLLGGLVAGAFWRYAPGAADVIIRDDLRRLQHPLVILLLISAGTLAPFTPIGLPLAAAYVLTRFTGKLLGGWVVSRALPTISPADLGSYLLSPGVLGLGFALNFHIVAPSVSSAAALTAVALGTLVSEIVAALAIVGPRASERGPDAGATT